MAKKKVLIVDDEPDFLALLKIRLEANDYEVISASNGKEALDKIKKEKPNAVLLDILMPQLDGLKTLEKIRRLDKDLPVFMITAFSSEERFGLAKKLGASGFIVKTDDLKEEIDNIRGALNIADKYRAKKGAVK